MIFTLHHSFYIFMAWHSIMRALPSLPSSFLFIFCMIIIYFMFKLLRFTQCESLQAGSFYMSHHSFLLSGTANFLQDHSILPLLQPWNRNVDIYAYIHHIHVCVCISSHFHTYFCKYLARALTPSLSIDGWTDGWMDRQIYINNLWSDFHMRGSSVSAILQPWVQPTTDHVVL